MYFRMVARVLCPVFGKKKEPIVIYSTEIRRGLFALLVGVGVAVGGCTSSTSPYGITVVPGGVVSGTQFGGNYVKVQSGEGVADNYELLPVYISEPVIESNALSSVENYSNEEFAKITRRSTREALAAYGRFAVVSRQEDAYLVVEPRVISVVPWNDTVTKDDGFKVVSEENIFTGGGKEMTSLEREGIDVSISLSFIRTDGAIIANERATGRLSSERGTIIRGKDTQIRGYSGSENSFQKLDQAALDEARLAEVLNDTTRGVVVLMLKQLDQSWWNRQRDSNGRRRLNTTQLGLKDSP